MTTLLAAHGLPKFYIICSRWWLIDLTRRVGLDLRHPNWRRCCDNLEGLVMQIASWHLVKDEIHMDAIRIILVRSGSTWQVAELMHPFREKPLHLGNEIIWVAPITWYCIDFNVLDPVLKCLRPVGNERRSLHLDTAIIARSCGEGGIASRFESIGNLIRIHRSYQNPQEIFRKYYQNLQDVLSESLGNHIRIQRKSFQNPKDLVSESIGITREAKQYPNEILS